MSEKARFPYCALPHNRLKCAWLHWVASFPWTHFYTLTFADYPDIKEYSPGHQRALSAAETWMHDITRYGGQTLMVMERGAEGHRIHWHGLAIGNEPSVLRAAKNWKWAEGFVKSEPLEELVAASAYLLKYVLKGQHQLLPWLWAKDTGHRCKKRYCRREGLTDV